MVSVPIHLLLITAFLATATFAQVAPTELVPWAKMRDRIVTKDRFSEVPPRVRDFHAKGTINVLLHIDVDGKVEKLLMLSGFNHIDFMRQYIETEVAAWRFKPLKSKGKFAPYRGIVSITFCYGGFPKKRSC